MFEKYCNPWGLCLSAYSQLDTLLSGCQNIRILEFGSGSSTEFLCDFALKNGTVEITSFDDNFKYMFKLQYPFLKMCLRGLLETDVDSYEKMYSERRYSPELMHSKVSKYDTRQELNFYDILPDDIVGDYDFVILDGPNGNGRNFAFLILLGHLKFGSYILIDDITHYDFIERFLSLFKAECVFLDSSDKNNFAIFRIIGGVE